MAIVNKLADGYTNIVVSKLMSPFDPTKDTASSLAEIQAILEKTPGTLYIVADGTELDPSFSQVVTGLAETTRPNSPLRNPRTETFIVAKGKIYEDMAQWYKQQQYGALTMRLYKTVDEAIAAIKVEIANKK